MRARKFTLEVCLFLVYLSLFPVYLAGILYSLVQARFLAGRLAIKMYLAQSSESYDRTPP